MQRIILHIDFDSFFASCEQQLDPLLRNKPLGVTAANSRTCIIASSREAKCLGIKTGSSSWDAYKRCPSIVLVPAHFTKYWEVSKVFIDICKDFSPYVEVFSIDELFMDVTKTAHLFGGVTQLIDRIKERIKNEVGEYITVSIGVSHNKLLAKLGSGLKKPNGVVEITHENLNHIYASSELTDICGIGERIKRRLVMMGITTLTKLRDVPLRCLVAEFGNVEGNFLKNIGLGIDDSEVNPYTTEPDVKSVGRNYCLARNEYDMGVVLQNFYELCEEVAIKLRKLDKVARTVHFALRGNVNIGGRKTFPQSFDTGREMYEYCMSLLPVSFWNYPLSSILSRNGRGRSFIPTQNEDETETDPQLYFRQIHISVSNLHDKSSSQLSFFYKPKLEKVWKTVDAINDKFGDHTIRNGFLLYSDKLTTVPNGYMADTYERIKLAREADY